MTQHHDPKNCFELGLRESLHFVNGNGGGIIIIIIIITCYHLYTGYLKYTSGTRHVSGVAANL
jgi:type IV secretory pathway VirB2 component (pilin)